MVSLVLMSLPVLLVLDTIVVWLVRRRGLAQMEAHGKRDKALDGISSAISIYLAVVFVVLFIVYVTASRNPWQSLGITMIVSILNVVTTLTVFALMGRRG